MTGKKYLHDLGLSSMAQNLIGRYFNRTLIRITDIKKEVKAGRLSHYKVPKLGEGMMYEICKAIGLPMPKNPKYNSTYKYNPYTGKQL